MKIRCYILYIVLWLLTNVASLSASVAPTIYQSGNISISTAAVFTIFSKYGQNDTLSFDQFEHLLHSLGIGHVTDVHTESLHDERTESQHDEHVVMSSDIAAHCLEADDLLEMSGFDTHNTHNSLSQDEFLALCPLLILQLDSKVCTNSEGHGRHDDHTAHNNNTGLANWQSPAVWGYSVLACVIISAVGLVAVAIIPIMHKVIYNHMLQFLVALAIGSLTGDAVLHLLPHAMTPHNEHSHDLHDKHAIWCGLTALAGIYLFFLVERIVGLCSERKRKHYEQNINKLRHLADTSMGSVVNGSLLHTNNSTSLVDQSNSASALSPLSHINSTRLSRHTENTTSCEEILMMVHTNKDVRKFADAAHNEVHQHCEPQLKEETWGPTNGGHHHSHHVPGSVASVAWMVIVGDGFHNFADGLAIGSSFASSLTGGLSTSIAVFCHELPHELGDFAMLLNAGMSAKQALVYNCVSSLLCLFGMVVGVVVGNIAVATSWIFALIAGLFLYVALVDMLPEMTSMGPKKGEHPLFHLALQNSGMLVGVSVMLVIALFEDKLQDAFSSSHT